MRAFTLLAVLCVSWLVAVASANAQGAYSPVSPENVLALELNHYFTPDKKGHQPDFTWKFAKGKFVLKKGEGRIPADLCDKLIGKGDGAPDEIRGKWRLDDKDTRQLVFYDILIGGKTTMKEVRLAIYKTAPTVVRIGEPQYVFGIGR